MNRGLELALLCAVALGCSDVVVAEFHVAGPTEAALAGATQLTLALEQGDELIREESFPPVLDALRLRTLPFGDGYRLRLDAHVGPFLVARGRSLPFSVSAGNSPRPDIWFAGIGTFESAGVETLDGPQSGCAIVRDGAVISTTAGSLYQYVHHDASDGTPALRRVVTHAELRDAQLLAVGSQLVAVGGQDSVARVLSSTGALGPALRVEAQRIGAVAAALDEGLAVLGGSEDGSSGTVARVLGVNGDELSFVRESSLPCPIRNADHAVVSVTAPGTDALRVITVCDESTPSESNLVAFDPVTGSSIVLPLPGDLRTAAFAALGPGLLLVTGGRNADGTPSDASHVLAVGVDELQELLPGPDPLFAGREGHAMITLRPGLALVVGGRRDGPATTSELIAFPGDVVLTGSLSMPAQDPCVGMLPDGAVAVISEEGVGLYVVPR